MKTARGLIAILNALLSANVAATNEPLDTVSQRCSPRHLLGAWPKDTQPTSIGGLGQA